MSSQSVYVCMSVRKCERGLQHVADYLIYVGPTAEPWFSSSVPSESREEGWWCAWVIRPTDTLRLNESMSVRHPLEFTRCNRPAIEKDQRRINKVSTCMPLHVVYLNLHSSVFSYSKATLCLCQHNLHSLSLKAYVMYWTYRFLHQSRLVLSRNVQFLFYLRVYYKCSVYLRTDECVSAHQRRWRGFTDTTDANTDKLRNVCLIANNSPDLLTLYNSIPDKPAEPVCSFCADGNEMLYYFSWHTSRLHDLDGNLLLCWNACNTQGKFVIPLITHV